MHPITGRPFRELKPWFLLKTSCQVDIDIARMYGKPLWDYYRTTTPRQRLFERIVMYVEGQRQGLLRDYAERQAEQERDR